MNPAMHPYAAVRSTRTILGVRRDVLLRLGIMVLVGIGTVSRLIGQVGPLPRPRRSLPPIGGVAGSGRHSFLVRAGGFDWSYAVHVPRVYDARRRLPVVLVLHGSGGQGQTMLEKSGWARKAEEEGFLAVAPDALPSNPYRPSNFWVNPRIWNSGQLSPDAIRARINDTDFFRILLDDLAKKFSIDSRRVYVTGHSNGAAMTFKLGAELSERFAAIAPVSSVCWVKEPRPVHPMPTLFIVGDSDPLVPLLGGESVLPWGKRTTPPVVETLQLWARALGCPSRPRISERRDRHHVFVYGPGRDRVTLTAYFIDGQGHNWPGGKEIVPLLLGPENHQFNATDTIWNFFKKCEIRPANRPAASSGRRLREPAKVLR